MSLSGDAGSPAGIVTPEAVRLSFETAGVGSRVVAAVLDLATQGTALLILLLGLGLFGATAAGEAGLYFGLFAIMFAYPVAIETLWRGKSVGRAVLGLRVVTVEGGPIRFRHALVRGAMGLVDFWLTSGAAAVLSVLLTRRDQRLGDLVAGTLVVRERTGATAPSAATFSVPAGCEGYAATLDVSGLHAGDYQAVRALLLRASSLPPLTRDRLAREIATPLLGRMHHQPPPGVPPELFLVCVAAVYQQRQRRIGERQAASLGAPPSVAAPAAPVVAPGAAGGASGFAPPN